MVGSINYLGGMEVGGLKHIYCRQIFTLGPDVILK